MIVGRRGERSRRTLLGSGSVVYSALIHDREKQGVEESNANTVEISALFWLKREYIDSNAVHVLFDLSAFVPYY